MKRPGTPMPPSPSLHPLVPTPKKVGQATVHCLVSATPHRAGKILDSQVRLLKEILDCQKTKEGNIRPITVQGR